jgi:hypothetical protein
MEGGQVKDVPLCMDPERFDLFFILYVFSEQEDENVHKRSH